MKALIIVDVQNDFMTGGSLQCPLPGTKLPQAEGILPRLNAHLCQDYKVKVLTQDWHPSNHCSFASNLGVPAFTQAVTKIGKPQFAWPTHCEQNTVGAAIHPGLMSHMANMIIRKGTNPDCDSYSGCQDDGNVPTGLVGYLRENGITECDVGGIATDVCVKATVTDLVNAGFKVRLLTDCCVGTTEENISKAINDLKALGVAIV